MSFEFRTMRSALRKAKADNMTEEICRKSGLHLYKVLVEERENDHQLEVNGEKHMFNI